jgi:hypothetical protein
MFGLPNLSEIKGNVEHGVSEFKYMQKENGLKQRNFQMAMQMAAARDRVQWMGAAYGTVATAITLRLIAKKPVPGIVAVPMFVVGTVLAYQYDFAYGTKFERVRAEAEKIMHEEDHWFMKDVMNTVPVPPVRDDADK